MVVPLVRELAEPRRGLPAERPEFLEGQPEHLAIETEPTVERHHRTLSDSGELAAKRRRQQVDWTWTMVRDTLLTRLQEHPGVRALTADLEREVAAGELTPTLAAERILEVFADSPGAD